VSRERGTGDQVLEDNQELRSSELGKIVVGGRQRQPNMAKHKRKLTAAEKAEKKRRRKEYMTIFINGKQKRVKRPPTIDGMDVDEFIRRNADPIWLHQNEMWEYMTDDDESEES
jgi:uncharacterized protein YnzC (UPF0291/DUF896 family)